MNPIMRRRTLAALFVALAVFGAVPAWAADTKLCYQRGEAIYVATEAGASPKRLVAKGCYDPAISPDGRSVAYTISVQKAGEAGRRIAIVDVATGASKTLESVPGTNSYKPIWSPDGKMLAFQHWTDESRWEVAVVNADDTGFRILTNKIGGEHPSLSAAFWAPDGQSIYAYDFTALYRIDLSGKILDQRPSEKLFPELSTGYSFALSPDGTKLLYDTLEAVPDLKSDEGPPFVVYLYDMTAGTKRRVSPKGIEANHPAWSSSGTTFYFRGTRGRSFDVYRAPLAGGAATRVVTGGEEPSISAR